MFCKLNYKNDEVVTLYGVNDEAVDYVAHQNENKRWK